MDDSLMFAPCGFLSFQDDGGITQANDTLRTMLGSSDDLVGKNIESILTVASRIFYNTHFFPLIRLHLKAEEVFLTLRYKNGSEIPVLTNAVRRLVNGSYENHCIFMALHQRKKYEEEILAARSLAEETLKRNEALLSLAEQLEKRSQQLDARVAELLSIRENMVQFNKVISHDLQEPIRKILIFSDIILTGEAARPDAHLRNRMQKIVRAAERLKELTSGLEQFIKLEDEQTSPCKVNLNEVIAAAKSRVTSEKAFDDFDLINDGLPEIEGYRAQLELLFYHLLKNSLEHRHPSRRLVVVVKSVTVKENIFRATKDRYKYMEHAMILISDNGMGFDVQYREYVFDLLKKITPASSGLGLGLPISRKIVGNHSGTISVYSDPGKGTEVKIMLPHHNDLLKTHSHKR